MKVRFDVTPEGVAVLTLAGGDRLNRLDNAMRDGLIWGLAAAEDHPDVRALLLRAEGENFSAGADLREFGAARDIFEARWIRWRRDPWLAFWELSVPSVAALHGIALGSGFEISLLCDLRYCAPDARLGLPEARLAMLPGAGGTQSLARVISPDAALPMVLRGALLTPQEAAQAGIVHAVVPDVQATAMAAATRLAQLPRHAARAAKRALRTAADHPLRDGLAIERRLAGEVAALGQA
jgi:enoyl-CoA hydratase/carnithine racemase